MIQKYLRHIVYLTEVRAERGGDGSSGHGPLGVAKQKGKRLQGQI